MPVYCTLEVLGLSLGLALMEDFPFSKSYEDKRRGPSDLCTPSAESHLSTNTTLSKKLKIEKLCSFLEISDLEYYFLSRSDVAGVWSCGCREGWDGKDCATRLETQCGDGLDNDAGQLITVLCPSWSVLTRLVTFMAG